MKNEKDWYKISVDEKPRPLRRFLLFAFDDYHPSGGASDLIYDFATLEEAKDAAVGVSLFNTQILDLRTGNVEEVYT